MRVDSAMPMRFRTVLPAPSQAATKRAVTARAGVATLHPPAMRSIATSGSPSNPRTPSPRTRLHRLASKSHRRTTTPRNGGCAPTCVPTEPPASTRSPRIVACGTSSGTPMASRARRPHALTAPAHGLSRGCFDFSRRTTRDAGTPSRRTRWSAVLVPAGPPPTTTTSASKLISRVEGPRARRKVHRGARRAPPRAPRAPRRTGLHRARRTPRPGPRSPRRSP